MKKINKYYDINQLLSHNAYLSICMSGRGTGKSFSAKKKIIREFEKSNGVTQACYIRRTEKELDRVKDTYWKDIQEFYPNYDFSVEGNTGYINKIPVVYFIALSTSSTMKSATFPNVKFIFFDEYVITTTTHNRYLRNEMTLFFDLLETIGRDRKNVRVVILSNSVSFVNPLFTFFKIEPRASKRFQKFNNNLICLELFSSETFIEEKNKTPFAQLIKNTPYYRYAVGNMTLEDSDDFIKPKETGQYKFLCSFMSDGYEIGAWFNMKTCEVYVDHKIDSSYPYRFAMRVEDVKPSFNHIKEYRSKHYTIYEVRSAYNAGRLFFENQEIKKFFIDNVIRYL